jgi:hypothetical protein
MEASEAVSMLVSMGFSEDLAQVALSQCDTAEEALEWLCMNAVNVQEGLQTQRGGHSNSHIERNKDGGCYKNGPEDVSW